MVESNDYENITNFQNIMANDVCQYKEVPAFEECLSGLLNELKSR